MKLNECVNLLKSLGYEEDPYIVMDHLPPNVIKSTSIFDFLEIDPCNGVLKLKLGMYYYRNGTPVKKYKINEFTIYNDFKDLDIWIKAQ